MLFLKRYYSCFSPHSLNLVNKEINQIFLDIPREDSAISLKDSYLELQFKVTHRAGGHARYVRGDHIRIVKVYSLALFINYGLTSPSEKEKEEDDNSHAIC